MIAAAIAGATVAAWWLWLGWDTTYQTDPDTGVASGPYTAWQVAGCVLSLAVIAALGGRLLGPLVVTPVMTVTLTAAWSARAASSDETGLWLVGAVLVFVATAAGTALVSALARWWPRSGRRATAS